MQKTTISANNGSKCHAQGDTQPTCWEWVPATAATATMEHTPKWATQRSAERRKRLLPPCLPPCRTSSASNCVCVSTSCKYVSPSTWQRLQNRSKKNALRHVPPSLTPPALLLLPCISCTSLFPLIWQTILVCAHTWSRKHTGSTGMCCV